MDLPESKASICDVEKSLGCTLCKKIVIHPHIFLTCGHSFCYICVTPFLGKQCPTCHVPSSVKDLLPDRFRQSLLSDCQKLRQILGYHENFMKPSPIVDIKVKKKVSFQKKSRCRKIRIHTSKSSSLKQRPKPDGEDETKENHPTDCRAVNGCVTDEPKEIQAVSIAHSLENQIDAKDNTDSSLEKLNPNKGNTISKHKRKRKYEQSGEDDKLAQLSESEDSFLVEDSTDQSRNSAQESHTKGLTPGKISRDSSLMRKWEYKKNVKGETPLHVACIKGDKSNVSRLLSDGVDCNIKDNAGWTPLHEACIRGFVEIAELLLQNGASPNIPGLGNDTPLHEAVISDNVKLTKLLLKFGGNCYIRNSDGRSPLDLAKNVQMKKILSQSKPQNSMLVKSPPVGGKMVACGVGLPSESMKALVDLGKQMKIKVMNTFCFSVTHVFVETNEKGLCIPSYVYLQSVVSGCWIVKCQWIVACLKQNTILPCDEYEVQGSINCSPNRHPTQLSRLNQQQQNPKLLDGIRIFLLGNFNKSEYSKTEIINLIKLGGGTILTREPRPDFIEAEGCSIPFHAPKEGSLSTCSHYIIYQDVSSAPQLRYNMPCLQTLPLVWLILSIENFALADNTIYHNIMPD